MDLKNLRLFVRASDLNSFTKAAVSLGVAQPTISRVIGELEAEWGGPLFYRTGRGVSLSELGEAALQRARRLLRDADEISEELRGFSRQPSGHVALGLPPSVVSFVIPELVNQLRAEAPGIHLEIHEGFSDQIERWLAEGLIDLGLYSKYKEGTSIDTPSPLLQSRLVLAGAVADMKLPREIDFADLADFPLVLPAVTNGLRVMIDSIARRKKISLQIIVDADSTAAQKEIAANCGCFMIKAPHTIADRDSRRLYSTAIIRKPYVTRHIVLVTGQTRPLNRASREVVSRVTAILKQHSVKGGGARGRLQ
jgi:LysR family transcriptional regulator, nitrogen assimilation regulatory protein